jgi:DNA-binding NtrC family response regulator
VPPYAPVIAPASTRAGPLVRILVIEDDEGVRRLLERYLSRTGFDVTTAASMAAAIEVLSSDRAVDLILSDIDLPDGSGMSLVEHGRRTRRLPVVLMTGGANVSSPDVAAAADVIPKPFGLVDLRSRLLQVLATGGARQ